MSTEELSLAQLFEIWSGEEAVSIDALAGSGSYRRYFRIRGRSSRAIGVLNEDAKENKAFLSFTGSFRSAGLPVPEIYIASKEERSYLLQDLGDMTLFGLIEKNRTPGNAFPDIIEEIYRKVIGWLPRFQVEGAGRVDYDVCYPRAAFDRQSMMWDLNYFKYYFLKLARISFDEQKLEDDFNSLTDFLLRADPHYFMYRDFQSRNIMVMDGDPWFIDYQGGRKGPLQYDIASLLYDAKADIPQPVRETLLEHYLAELEKQLPVDRKDFLLFYDGFVLIRILQALGAYGFRGYYENKPHFLKSIPYAIQNLRGLLENDRLPYGLPMLAEVIKNMVENPRFADAAVQQNNLTVSIFSFSYKKELPPDPGGNGGGFVFDCRALPNPGKLEQFRDLTGKDRAVIDFLGKEQEVDEFLNHAFSLVDQSVKTYICRGFTSLMVSFGCTGGQHRSVYCAEQLAGHLADKFTVKVNVVHREVGNWRMENRE